jgi:hypothetical protein
VTALAPPPRSRNIYIVRRRPDGAWGVYLRWIPLVLTHPTPMTWPEAVKAAADAEAGWRWFLGRLTS